MTFADIISKVNDFVWGPVMLVLLVGTGIFLMIRLRFKPIRNLGYALRQVFSRHSLGTVSYTHLDVYKRQPVTYSIY